MSKQPRVPTARRALASACAALLLASIGALASSTAWAVDEPVNNASVFELDNNALDEASAGDDWELISGTGHHAKTIAFFPDPVNSGTDDNFTGGGSKDERDVSKAGITKTYWQNTLTTPPDKDDIEHAFAAAYDINGELVIYFGADRYSNSGDAAIGFWFFKERVDDNIDGTFSGKHSVGDVLVTSDFRQGGSASVINVFEWIGNGAGGPLKLIASSATSNDGIIDPASKLFCLHNRLACAVSNPAPVAVPSSWGGYTFKGNAPANIFPQGTFFEGGINISALFPGTGTCFASFMAMTRTSASTTAQLKDYALGNFPLCSMSVSKACPNPGTINTGGESVHTIWNVPVTNTGSGPLYSVAIAEESPLPGAFSTTCRITSPVSSGNLVTNTPVFVLASLAAGASTNVVVECDSTSTNLVNAVSAHAKSSSSGATRDVHATTYTASGTELCPINPPAGITVTKECAKSTGAPEGVKLIVGGGFEVCVNISVRNDSLEALKSVSIVDSDVGTLLTGGTMTPGQTLNYLNRCYVADTADGGETNPADAAFSDRVDVSGVTALTGQTVGDPALPEATATCKLCPSCPTCD